MNALNPFGERSLTLVAASFADHRAAERAAGVLKQSPALDGEVAVIDPGDPLARRKLEPEQRGIFATLLRSHLILGTAGLGVGLLVAWVAIAVWTAAAASPGFVLLFAGLMGGFIGMMVAGLITLRPDHGLVLLGVREALRRGRSAVVVRPLSQACAKQAFRLLRQAGAVPHRSW
ncbi:MAG: hypothetical protein U1F53_02385 [Burkholderiaceae bacterium]